MEKWLAYCTYIHKGYKLAVMASSHNAIKWNMFVMAQLLYQICKRILH